MNVDSLLKIDNGLFANGPKFILTQVDAILKNNGCETYFFGEQKSKLWLNNQWVEDTAEPITLKSFLRMFQSVPGPEPISNKLESVAKNFFS